MRVISIYPNFANSGGAQNVTLLLAKELNEKRLPIVLTNTPIQNIVSEYKDMAQFEPFSFKKVLKYCDNNTVFLSHHRKCTTLLMLLNLILIGRLSIIHVGHNTFTSLKYFSLYPKDVIAVSNGVKENLIEYFGIPSKNIKVIFNGLKDWKGNQCRDNDNEYIKILFPGRICSVKQQVDFVKQTRGKLLPHIHVYFAGTGYEEDVNSLKKEIGDSFQFSYLGHISMEASLSQFDYVCLFSKNEGLGLSLIEGCILGKPLITNSLTSVCDVNVAGETGFVYSDFCSLIEGINNLPSPYSDEYIRLSKNARQRYEDCFTEEKMIAHYKEVISHVLSTKNGKKKSIIKWS